MQPELTPLEALERRVEDGKRAEQFLADPFLRSFLHDFAVEIFNEFRKAEPTPENLRQLHMKGQVADQFINRFHRMVSDGQLAAAELAVRVEPKIKREG